MLKIESKAGRIHASDKKIYHFLSDFNNFSTLVPHDKIKNWEATEDTCSFSADGIGNIGMRIIEKEPCKLIKITADERSNFNFYFWIQLKSIAEIDTGIKLTIQADINPMLAMIAKKPLQKFIDLLVDQLINYFQTNQTGSSNME